METALRERFWERYSLEELTPPEWEALCDGCGQCCLLKLHDDETQELAILNVACRLLDTHSCQCSDYENRFESVPDCTQLTPALVKEFTWLPQTCGYRRVAEGRNESIEKASASEGLLCPKMRCQKGNSKSI